MISFEGGAVNQCRQSLSNRQTDRRAARWVWYA